MVYPVNRPNFTTNRAAKLYRPFASKVRDESPLLAKLKPSPSQGAKIQRPASSHIKIRSLLKIIATSDNLDHIDRAFKKVMKIGKADTHGLVKCLTDPDKDVRFMAADMLGELGKADKTVVRALAKSLADKYWKVRESAAYAMGRIALADARAVVSLVYALKDSFWCVRWSVVWALGRIGMSSMEFISGPNERLIRVNVIGYIAHIRRTDRDARVRRVAAQSLRLLKKIPLSIRRREPHPSPRPRMRIRIR